MALEEKVSRLARAKKWGKRVLIGSTLAVSAPFILTAASIPIAKATNHCFTSEDKKAAVFVSGVDYERSIPQLSVDIIGSMLGYGKETEEWLPKSLRKSDTLSKKKISGLTSFVMYTPLVIRQTLEGNRVEWYRNSAKADITDILKNPNYNTIGFVGHGSYCAFQADDGIFSTVNIKKIDDLPPKEAVIQHTCTFGKGKKEGLRESLKAPRGYAVGSGYVTEMQNYGEAWKRVFTGY